MNKEVQLQLLVVDFVNIFVFMLLVLFFFRLINSFMHYSLKSLRIVVLLCFVV